jgi:30S ribosomal protein S31
MGRGDKKTTKGKIFKGSFGKHRPKKDYMNPATTDKKVEKKVESKKEEA